jgi:hypothetical protein
MRAERSPAGVAAAICAVVFGGCSYNWTSVVPAAPAVIPRRRSAVVTIATQDLRMQMHHTSWWHRFPGDSLVGSNLVVTGYHDLDVRTCKASWRWGAPVGPEPDGSDLPVAERSMFGPVRFYASDDRSNLMATNAATAQTWTAASGFNQIAAVAAVPAARRVVVSAVVGGVFVYDVDAHRVVACR